MATVKPHRVRSVQKERLVALWHQHVTRRSRLQLLAAAIFVLGALSLVVENATVGGCRVMRHSVDMVQRAWQTVSRTSAIQEPTPTTPPPPSAFATKTERLCYYLRDVGLETEIRNAQKTFCATQGRTQVAIIDLEERRFNMRALMFKRDLRLDFTGVTIHQPIASLAEDGGDHDPRFNWNDAMVACGCDELQQYAAQRYADSGNTSTLRLWDPQFMNTPADHDTPSTVCASSQSVEPSSDTIQVREKTILIARRDDHNPFFQISNALNAWLLMRTYGWNKEETRVVHMDGGYESPIDALHHALLSSPDKYEIMRGRADLMGRRFHFTNDVILAPYEVSGPMMQHLNNKEPCFDSHLFKEFRAKSLEALGVSADNYDMTRQITVTIITRRNYGGRTVQRRWLNEDEVLAAMRTKYTNHHGLPIVIQSVDFVDLSLAEQMEVALTSDVVIGMHGAGMVNVLWTKPETLVVEIFPKRRFRWGYRNLCQFIGCDWRQFRGGNDTGKGDNKSDKTIPVDQWDAFFDPLFTEYLAKLSASKRTQGADDQQLAQRLRR